MGSVVRTIAECSASVEPTLLEAIWRQAVKESFGGVLRKPSFLDWYDDDIKRRGVPNDAETCQSFAGPPGVVTVLGTSFGRRAAQSTQFVYWTEATAMLGRGKRDAVHSRVGAAIVAAYPDTRFQSD